MSGTVAGGRKAAKTNLERYGKDFYVNIGRKGGANGHTGGFASSDELAREAGRKGGMISSRSKIKPTLDQRRKFYNAKMSGIVGESKLFLDERVEFRRAN